MIRTLAIALSTLSALAAPAMAQVTASLAPERPILRAEAVVTGDVVRIGDLIDHAGIVADIPVFRAPDLGSTGTVSAAQVADAVRPHAIVGLDTGGLSQVTVIRASRAVAAEDIQARIVSALAAQFALGAPKDIVLTFDQNLRPIEVEPSAKGAPQIARLTYDQRNGRFDATVEIPGGARRRITGIAVPTAEVLTLTRSLARGEIVKAADLVTTRRPRGEIAADMLTSAEQATGLAARNALTGGRPLRGADVMKPDLVRRNENVTLIYEVPGITLTLRGKASEAGSEGDVIEVLNVQSKRMVQGIIVGQGRVLVSQPTPSVVAESEVSKVSSKAPPRAQ